MNGPLDCPFCGNRPTHWYVEKGQPYVVCDSHSEPIRMRLSDWNVRASLVGDPLAHYANELVRRIERAAASTSDSVTKRDLDEIATEARHRILGAVGGSST